MIYDYTETHIHNVVDLRIGIDSEKREPCLIIETGGGKQFVYLSPSDPFKAARLQEKILAYNVGFAPTEEQNSPVIVNPEVTNG